jgi:hypothetical protein
MGTSWLGRSAPRLYGATLARASKIMAPTSCFTGQVHRLPDAPEAYGAMITRAKAAPPQSRSADLRERPGRSATETPSVLLMFCQPSAPRPQPSVTSD